MVSGISKQNDDAVLRELEKDRQADDESWAHLDITEDFDMDVFRQTMELIFDSKPRRYALS